MTTPYDESQQPPEHPKQDRAPDTAKVIPFPLHLRRTIPEARLVQRCEDSPTDTELSGIDGLPSADLALVLADRLRRPRAANRLVALAIVHFPEFEQFEQAYGVAVSSELGRVIHERLSGGLRESDELLQLDSDTFAVLLDDFYDREAIDAALQRLQDHVSGAYRLGRLPLSLSTRVGVALYPVDTADPEELVRYARVALRHASPDTVAIRQFFESSYLEQLRERVSMRAMLEQAIEANRLELHYQPQYAVDSGALVGAEALLRLRDETGALIAPDRFIGIAEESGLIVPIGQWVIREACQQLAQWRAEGLTLKRVAVNLSARQLRDEALVPTIREAVRMSGIDYEDLELELTEAQAIENRTLVVPVLEKIAALGVRIAVDDFGTGYSALSYLSCLPLNVLKIDRSFIKDAVGDPRTCKVVGAIVAMAKELDLAVTVEGIETEAQHQLAAQAGCNLAQGFHLSMPVPPERWRLAHSVKHFHRGAP